MKTHKQLLTLCLMLSGVIIWWTVTAYAVPLPSMPEPSLYTQKVPIEDMPAEVEDAFSQQQVATFSQALLLARSEELRDLIIHNPDDPYLLHELATVTFHLGSEHEASVLWAAAHKREENLAPADLMSAVHRVFALLEQGDAETAQSRLTDIEERFALQPHFQLMRAEQAMRGQNFEQARQSFAKAYQLAPQLYVTALNFGRYQEFSGDQAQALQLYQEASRLAPNRPETWLYLGSLQARRKQEQEALQSFRQLQDLVSSGATAEKRLADFYLHNEEYLLAEKWYQAALIQEMTPGEKANIQTILGDILLRLGKFAAARTQVEAALAYQESPQLLFVLGTIDEEQGKAAAAEARYRRVLELMPGNPLAANNLAMLLIKENHSQEEALRLADQARKAIPENLIIESTYGCALTENGRHAEAIAVLGPVLSAAAQDSWARYCLGRSLYKKGRHDEASAVLQRLLLDDPAFKHQTDIKKLLQGR